MATILYLIAVAIPVLVLEMVQSNLINYPHQADLTTNYDQYFKVSCNDFEHLSGFVDSLWSGYHKDRNFTFECRRGFVTTKCQWSNENGGFVNNLDGDLKYECPSEHLISGVESLHLDWFEDRMWNFKCCQV